MLKKPVMRLDKYIKVNAANLLGHIIRRDDEDPLRIINFTPGTINLNEYPKKRVGNPRIVWANKTIRFIWKHLRGEMGRQGV